MLDCELVVRSSTPSLRTCSRVEKVKTWSQVIEI